MSRFGQDLNAAGGADALGIHPGLRWLAVASRRMSTLAACWLALVLMSAGLFAQSGPPEPKTLGEARARVLFFIGMYTYWPPDTFPRPSDPFVVGVVGEKFLEDDGKDYLEKLRIQKRRVVVKTFRYGEQYEPCHLLVIDERSNVKRVEEVLEAVEGKPVLTIGRVYDFHKLPGGLIYYLETGARRSAGKAVCHFDQEEASRTKFGFNPGLLKALGPKDSG